MIKLNQDDFKTNSSPRPLYIDKGIPVSIASFASPTEETNEKPKEVKILPETAGVLPYPKEKEPEPMPSQEGGKYEIPEGVNKPQPITDSFPGQITFLLLILGLIVVLVAISLKE